MVSLEKTADRAKKETQQTTPPRKDAGAAEGADEVTTNRGVLFQAIANFTYDWETWAGSDGVARWVNPAVERITGYSAAECLAMPDYPLRLVHEEDQDEIAALLRDAARGGSGNDVEFRIRHKDGQIAWGAVSWQTIADDGGRPLGYRTSVRDITKRKEVEEALKLAHREAERANLAKSRFLAAASHDLRQPIQAAAMFVAALKTSHSVERRTEIIESIQESLRATDDLLNALLDVSRLDAGVLQPRLRPFAIGDILERMELEFRGLAQEKRLRFRLVQSSATVYSDPLLVERMVGNLVSNALRYTETGSLVIGCRHRGDSLRLEVWDSGIGIAEDDLETIFEEFHQLGNPERDRTRGLGLGLAIVKRLSRLLGHRVTVRSRLGGGSVFAIELPLTAAKVERRDVAVVQAGGADLTGALAGRFILAIDDDPVQLAAMQAVFAHWDCDSVTAASAADALDQLALRERRPDAIVADYRLRGGANGAAAIQTLQKALEAPIPAVILTGDTEPARLAEAAASGFEILHKPVRPELLHAKLCELLTDIR